MDIPHWRSYAEIEWPGLLAWETLIALRTDVITGHSLGGSLATLAAYEVRELGKRYGRDKKLTCITFGAPRYLFFHRLYLSEFSLRQCYSSIKLMIVNTPRLVRRGQKHQSIRIAVKLGLRSLETKWSSFVCVNWRDHCTEWEWPIWDFTHRYDQ